MLTSFDAQSNCPSGCPIDRTPPISADFLKKSLIIFIELNESTNPMKKLGKNGNNILFKFVVDNVTQQAANEQCHKMNAQLVSIHSAEENDFLLGSAYWGFKKVYGKLLFF
jgi:hypothetical protein